MARDDFAEKFSKVLYTYLWYAEDVAFFTDTLIIKEFTANVLEIRGEVLEFADVLEFVTETSKAIFLLSVLTRPALDEALNNCFKQLAVTRIRIFTFLTAYCFDNHERMGNGDIFDVVLHTFTFVYRIAVYCWKLGHREYVIFAAMCWSEIFNADLKVQFHASGGWREFMTYVAEKRYASKDGNIDQRTVATFLDEIDYHFPNMGQERPDAQPTDPDSEDTLNNLEVVEPQTNTEAAESSADTTASNVPGFNEKGEASVEIDKQHTGTEAAESSPDAVASNVPGFKEKGEASVEVYGSRTNSEDSDFGFRTPAADKPWFHEMVKSLLIDFDDISAKIVTLVKEFEGKTSADDVSSEETSPAIQKDPKESLV